MKKVFVLLSMMVFLSSIVFATTEFNLPTQWIRMPNGTSIDANKNGIVDLSENSNLLEGIPSSGYVLLALHIADNSSMKALVDALYSSNSTLFSLMLADNSSQNSQLSALRASNFSIYALEAGDAAKIAALITSNASMSSLMSADNASIQSKLTSLVASNVSIFLLESADNSSLYSRISLVNSSLDAKINLVNSSIVNATFSSVANFSQYTNLSNFNVNTSVLKTTNNILDIVSSYWTNLYASISSLKSIGDSLQNNISNLNSSKVDKSAVVAGVNSPIFINGVSSSVIDGGFNISMPEANDSTGGFLSSVDHTFFVSKLNYSDQRYNETLRIIVLESSNSSMNLRVLALEGSNSSSSAVILALLASNTSIFSLESADNSSINNQLSSLRTSNSSIFSLESADNSSQASQLVALRTSNTSIFSLESANNQTQANELSALRTSNASIFLLEAADNSSQKAYTDSQLTTKYYNVTTINAITGTPQGTVASIVAYDDVPYNISETNSDFNITLNFTNSYLPNQMIIRYATVAGEIDSAKVYLWDFDDSSWESYATLTDTGGVFNVKNVGIYDPSSHSNSSNVSKMMITTVNAQTRTDKWQFDWVTLSKGVATPSGSEIDPLSIHKDGAIPLTANWDTGGYNITIPTLTLVIANEAADNSSMRTISGADNTTQANLINQLQTSNTTATGRISTLETSNTTQATILNALVTDMGNLSQAETVLGTWMFNNDTYFNGIVYMVNTSSSKANTSFCISDLAGNCKVTIRADAGTGNVSANVYYENGNSLNNLYNFSTFIRANDANLQTNITSVRDALVNTNNTVNAAVTSNGTTNTRITTINTTVQTLVTNNNSIFSLQSADNTSIRSYAAGIGSSLQTNISNLNSSKAGIKTCNGNEVLQNTTTTGGNCMNVTTAPGGNTSNSGGWFNTTIDTVTTLNVNITKNVSMGYGLMTITNNTGYAYFNTSIGANFSLKVYATDFCIGGTCMSGISGGTQNTSIGGGWINSSTNTSTNVPVTIFNSGQSILNIRGTSTKVQYMETDDNDWSMLVSGGDFYFKDEDGTTKTMYVRNTNNFDIATLAFATNRTTLADHLTVTKTINSTQIIANNFTSIKTGNVIVKWFYNSTVFECINSTFVYTNNNNNVSQPYSTTCI